MWYVSVCTCVSNTSVAAGSYSTEGLLNRKLRIGQRDRGCMRRRKALIAEGLGHTDGWCVTGARAQDRAYKEKERRGVEGCMMQ